MNTPWIHYIFDIAYKTFHYCSNKKNNNKNNNSIDFYNNCVYKA